MVFRITSVKFGFKVLLASLVMTFTAMQLSAQMQTSLFNVGNQKKSNSKAPTVITSDTMSIDIQNNIAIFTGNVEVDDPQMHIRCHKMIIYLEDKSETAKKTDDDSTGNKEVSKVECIGDVVITRKVDDPDEKEKGTQRALAGKADYDVKTGVIVLTEDPVIFRGNDKIKGQKIILWRDSQRMQVEGGSKIEMNPDAPQPAAEDTKAE